jgi:hypothetical protein
LLFVYVFETTPPDDDHVKLVETLCGHNTWLLKYGEKNRLETIFTKKDDVSEDVGKILRNRVRWLWIEKQGRELLRRAELTENCSAKRGGRINGC